MFFFFILGQICKDMAETLVFFKMANFVMIHNYTVLPQYGPNLQQKNSKNLQLF